MSKVLQELFDALNPTENEYASCYIYFVLFCTQLMITNLTRFNQNLAGMKPMFQVEAMLSAPEILLAPAATEVYKLCMQSVRDCVEG